jgi:hypothetical protein
MRKQMYKLHQPHVKSGYIEDVEYRGVLDDNGEPDWEILYVPGKKARAEYFAFTKNVRAEIRRRGDERVLVEAVAPAAQAVTPLVEELTKRGVSEKRARALIESLPSAQPAREQLLWADSIIASSNGGIRNPPGFYIHVLEANILPPQRMTSRTTRVPRPVEPPRQPEDEEYRAYREALIDKHIVEELGNDRFEKMVEEKARELKRTVGSLKAETIRQVSVATVRGTLLKSLPHATAEEFSAKRKAA